MATSSWTSWAQISGVVSRFCWEYGRRKDGSLPGFEHPCRDNSISTDQAAKRRRPAEAGAVHAAVAAPAQVPASGCRCERQW